MTPKISEDDEILVLCLKLTSRDKSDFKSVFKSWYDEEYYKIDEIRDLLYGEFYTFFGISNKKDVTERDVWNVCCVLNEKENFRVCSSSHDEIHSNLDEAFDDFRTEMKILHANIGNDGSYSIIDALKAINILSYESLDEINKTLIEVGLDKKFRTPDAAMEFIVILKKFLDDGNELNVKDNQLNNLLRFLTSENFDGHVIQFETIKILKVLKIKNFAEFSERNLEKIQRFLSEHRDAYKDEISCYEKSVKTEPKNLGHIMQCRVDFLTSIAIFGGDVYAEDLLEILTLRNSKNALKEKEENLKQIGTKIDGLKSNRNLRRNELIRTSCDFLELKKEIIHVKANDRVKSNINIGEFLIEFGNTFDDLGKRNIDSLKSEILTYVDNNILSQLEASSILTILSKIDIASFEDVPNNILSAINEKEIDREDFCNSSENITSQDGIFENSLGYEFMNKIIDFGLQKTLTNPQNYLGFINKILAVDRFTEKVVIALQKYENSLSVSAKLNKELIKAIDYGNILDAFYKMNEILKHNEKLPARAFKFLATTPIENETFEMVNKIFKINVQTIPYDLLKAVTNEIDKSEADITSSKIEVAECLMARNLVKIDSIENFCIKVLKMKKNASLKIIYNAVQSGQELSPILYNAIRNLQPSKYNRSLLNSITNSETKLSKLMSGKIVHDSKLFILDEMEKCPEEYQNEESVECLISLVLYEESLAKRAFEVLTKVISNYTTKLENERLCKIIFYASRCNTRIDIIEKFLLKFDFNSESLLESCKDKDLIVKLTEALNNAHFIELSDENLKYILSLSRKLTKAEILFLLSALEERTFLVYYGTILDALSNSNIVQESQKLVKLILLKNPHHFMFERILNLLPKSVGEKIIKEIKEPKEFIDETIDELEKSFMHPKVLENLESRNLLQHFTGYHVRALENICRGIWQEIEQNDDFYDDGEESFYEFNRKLMLLKILRIISSLKDIDEDFSKDLLKKVCEITKINNDIVKNSPESLNLSVALLYAFTFNVPFDLEIFKSSPSNLWSQQVLIQILLAFCNDYNEFELQNFAERIGEIEKNKNELLITIIEKFMRSTFETKEVTDLIVILKSDVNFFDMFSVTTDEEDSLIPIRLHESWLKSILSEKCIGENFQGFKLLMNYRPYLIDKLLNADDKNQLRAEDFIKMFKGLQLSSISHVEKCNKLLTLCSFENTSWLVSIELFLIDSLTKTTLNAFDGHKLRKFKKFLRRIYHIGWSLESIYKILESIETEEDMIKTTNFLRSIHEYQIGELHSNLEDEHALKVILKDCDWKQKFKSLYDILIQNTFGSAHEKSLIDLCDEITKNNPQLKLQFMKKFAKVKESYQGMLSLIDCKTVIKDWIDSDITRWSKAINVQKSSAREDMNDRMIFQIKLELGIASNNAPSIYEIIAVLIRAIEIYKDYTPRGIQILSVLTLLNPDEGKGRLVQINTGEGKTTIVAMLAVIKALQGHTVDVITSSPELAKPQANELKDFYKMFGLTVAHNGNDPVEKSIRYKCDIVYGAASDFQGDILRDEYSKLGTRSGRTCDFAIVDEVDSMLIDGRNHIVMLSSSMPCMNYLEHFYAIIWTQMKLFAEAIKENNGQYYLVQSDVMDEEGNLNENRKEVWIPLKESKESFIKNKLIESLRKELENEDKSYLKVPNHLRELILSYQLEKWIECAIYAKYHSKKDRNYILDNGKIVPVDCDNTGVLQESMNWSNGLHQFLQIKHGAKITPESLTTNYISNVAFFKRYGSNLFGLTGTLGSENAKKLLEKTYNVDSVIIPPFKVKRFKELSAIIENTKNEYYDEIVESNMNHLHNQRAVLIITPYISEAQELHKRFTLEFNNQNWNLKKIREYKTDHESLAVSEIVKSGDLIIATYIAGRGTDIKTSENVEANGGLHVCVTSLPSNERVEQQNFGRTSRTGNLGTSQFIIYDNHHSDIKSLRALRDGYENQDLYHAKKDLEKTLLKDKVFEKFCDLLDTVKNKTVKKAIEDRFGIWLQMHGETSENLVEDFDKFELEIKKDLEQNSVIKNPAFHVLLGNEYLKLKKFINAIEEYTKAIELEGEFSDIAFYNRGYARIALNRGGAFYDKDEFVINEAVKDFESAREKIKQRETELSVIQQAKEDDSKVLSEQVSHKLILYSIQKNAIERAIGMDPKEHEETIEDLNREKINMEEALKKIPEMQERFSQMENLEDKLKSLKEKREKLANEERDLTQITFEITNLLKSPEYEEYSNLKYDLELNKSVPENLKKNQEQIDTRKSAFENGKDGEIIKALKENRDMNVEVMGIPESLPEDQDLALYTEEIEEFASNGMLGAIQISKLPPIDWASVCTVLALGVGQIVLGGALCIFTLGTGGLYGGSMLIDGISDVFTAVKDGIINRSFSWVQYGIQKVINYASNIICMGLIALKDAAKTTAAGVEAIGAKSTIVIKRGWKLVAKKIGLEISKKVGNEVLNQLINFGIDRALLPIIDKVLTETLAPLIIRHLQSNTIVNEWLQIDEKKRNKKYQAMIIKIAQTIIQKEQQKGTFREFAEGIAYNIGCYDKADDLTSGVENKMEEFKKDNEATMKALEAGIEIVVGVGDRFGSQYFKNYDAIKKGAKTIMETKNLVEFTLKFLKKFENEIEKKRNEEIKNFKKNGNFKVNEQQNEIIEDRAPETVIQQCILEKRSWQQCSDESFPYENTHEEQVVFKQYKKDHHGAYKEVAEMVTAQITHKINGHFLAPYACSLAANTIDTLTENLRATLDEEIGHYKSERRIEFLQDKDKDNRLSNEQKQAHLDDKVINGVAKQIAEVEKGAKIGLQHLGSVSDACGVKIIVYDEKGNLVRTIGKGRPVEVRYKDGHYTLPDGTTPGGSQNQNDCLFNVIAHQLGTPEEAAHMRTKTVQALIANRQFLAYQYYDVEFLKATKRTLLNEGGITNPKRESTKKFVANLRNKKILEDVEPYGDKTK